MMAPVVAAFCAGLSGAPQTDMACNKAYEAYSTQYEIDKKLDKIAGKYGKQVELYAREQVNETVATIAAGIFTVAVAQQVKFSTRDVPFVENTVVILKPNQFLITFIWSM